VLDPLWGRITRVTVHPTHWPVVPRKVPVTGHVVNVGCFLAEQDPHELLVLSSSMGRWNLLVIPPRTDPVSAAWPMAASSDLLGTSTASRLMEEAARLRTVSESDRAVEAVWDCEGGHEVPAVRSHFPRVHGSRSSPPRCRISRWGGGDDTHICDLGRAPVDGRPHGAF